jgi:hypothetical protein
MVKYVHQIIKVIVNSIIGLSIANHSSTFFNCFVKGQVQAGHTLHLECLVLRSLTLMALDGWASIANKSFVSIYFNCFVKNQQLEMVTSLGFEHLICYARESMI